MQAIKKHHEAFWENRCIENRCCLYLTSQKTNEASKYQAKNLIQKWEDTDFRYAKANDDIENTNYYAEAFPTIFTDFGPGSLAEFVGGNCKWAWDTVWYDQEPIITDFENIPEIKLNKGSKVFKIADELTIKYLQSDKFATSIPDIGGILDTLAALRGSQPLLYDLYDYPGEIMKVSEELQGMWCEAYDHFFNLTFKKQGYMTSWMPIICEQKYYPLQCDFSAMISPEMFKKFVMPELEFQTNYLDKSIYHLDGVGEIPHLEHLLSLPRLNAIQWTAGAGQPDLDDECWYPMYKQIQKAGKGLVLLGASTKGIEKLAQALSPNGLFISGNCKDEIEANEIIKSICK